MVFTMRLFKFYGQYSDWAIHTAYRSWMSFIRDKGGVMDEKNRWNFRRSIYDGMYREVGIAEFCLGYKVHQSEEI
jgi:hypothetical protein